LARAYYAHYNAFDYPILFYASGFAVTIFAALRLAKFNIDSRQATEFRGLPSPSMALVVVSLPLIIIRDEMHLTELLTNSWVLLGLIALLSYLMVSDIPMLSLKIKSFSFKENQWLYGLILLAIVVIFLGVFVFQVLFAIIPIIIFAYILLSITKNITENGL
jgi:CDP-diacylglycerol--serine O-phosphatidyltransferase